MCCVPDRACELFGDIIRDIFGCGYFVDECGWRCSVGYTMYGLPKSVCVVPVIPMCI